VEDVAARQAELRLELQRRVGLDAGGAIVRTQQAVLDRLRQDAIERAQRCRHGGALGAVMIERKQSRRHV